MPQIEHPIILCIEYCDIEYAAERTIRQKLLLLTFYVKPYLEAPASLLAMAIALPSNLPA